MLQKFSRLGLLILLLLLLQYPGPAGAIDSTPRPIQSSAPGPVALIRLDPQISQHFVPPPEYYLRSESIIAATDSATIIVNYNGPGWTVEAQDAFAYAAGIWEALISSPVPIEVDATFNPLPTGVLGGAGATKIYMNFANAPQTDTWYPVATANSLAGTDLNGDEAEIVAQFSSTYSSWYFGTGSTPIDKINFASVVLHELGHGLGFFGSMRVDDGSGGIECNGILGVGCYGYENPSDQLDYPMIYDFSTENGVGDALLSIPNDSAALGSALISNDIYFNSASAIIVNGGSRVPLYAPSSWQPGSSYSHLAESYNPTEHALMTYSIAKGETIYSPGSVTLCMFSDMGWTVVETCPDIPILGLIATNDSPTELGSATQLTASIASGSNVEYEWDFGDGGGGIGAETTHVYASTGSYTAIVTATNTISSTSASTQVEIIPATVHISDLTADNDGPTVLGDTTQLTASTASGSDVSYEWDFGDGGVDSGAVVTHEYESTGTYTATVSASNLVSSATEITIVFVDSLIDGLSADSNSPVKLGVLSQFSSSVTDGSNVSYEWDFGDGASSYGALVDHIYTAAGTYTATVSAANTVSQASAATVVEIFSIANHIYIPLLSKH